jgi:hypothetical protein
MAIVKSHQYIMKQDIRKYIALHIIADCGKHYSQGSDSKEMIDAVMRDFVETRTPGDVHWALCATHLYGGSKVANGESGLYFHDIRFWIKEINTLLLSDIRDFGPDRRDGGWLQGEGKKRVVGYFLANAAWDASPADYGLDLGYFVDDPVTIKKLVQFPFSSQEEWEASGTKL